MFRLEWPLLRFRLRQTAVTVHTAGPVLQFQSATEEGQRPCTSVSFAFSFWFPLSEHSPPARLRWLVAYILLGDFEETSEYACFDGFPISLARRDQNTNLPLAGNGARRMDLDGACRLFPEMAQYRLLQLTTGAIE